MIRPARSEDMEACAAILNNWIDATEWMPRIHSEDDVIRHYRETVFIKRNVSVADAGGKVAGYLAVDEPTGEITTFYVAQRGRGIGGLLIRDAQARYPQLSLWTFQQNQGARRFYARHGFAELERSDGENGENEEGLPDIRLGWRREVAT